MRLICPSCRAQYEIEADLIPLEGRDVQCSACDNVWFQTPPQPESPALLSQAQRVLEAPAPAVPFLQDPAARVEEDLEVHFPPRAFQAPVGPEEDLPPEDEGDLDAQILKRHSLDESMMAILREEAMREETARLEEEERLRKARNLDFQTTGEAPDPEGPRLRIRPRSEAATEAVMHEDVAQPEHPVSERPLSERPTRPQRRELLPDIEHINSTLEAPRAHRRPTVSLEGAGAASPSGFLRGFAAMILIALLIWALYIKAPQIIAMAPMLEGAMTTYVGVIDVLRNGLNEIVAAGVKVMAP